MSSIIIIDGNIGCGKSTLTEFIASHYNYRPMFEPVKENPFLERFYKDPDQYAAVMQFWLMARRFEMHQEALRHVAQTGQGVVMDRSIYADWMFARKLNLDGHISDDEYMTYMAMRKVMEKMLYIPWGVIYLKTNPEVCLERIKSRSRNCETNIPLGYLQGLEALFPELFQHMQDLGVKHIYTWDWNAFPTKSDLQAMTAKILAPNFQYPAPLTGEFTPA
jgi:deoxyadenosine/deoxycytidine kinase